MEIAVCAEYSDGDRQVEARSFFFDIGGSQIHRHAVDRKKESAVVYRGAYSLSALTNGRIGQPNHRENGHHAVAASRSQVALNIHDVGVDAENGCANCFE